MEELLKFNKLGQWTLVKTKENGFPTDQDYLSYRPLDLQGTLPEDHGQKGTLHHSPNRLPKHNSKKKLLGTTPTPTKSQYADRHPGQVQVT